MDPYVIQRTSLFAAIAIAAGLHAVFGLIAWGTWEPRSDSTRELVDIELAPPPPPVEALPEEIARARQAMPEAKDEVAAATSEQPNPEDGTSVIDAGVDAPTDAPPDAAIDAAIDAARRRDAATDAASDAPVDAPLDALPATSDDAGETVASDGGAGDGQPPDDATSIAAIDPSDAGGSGSDDAGTPGPGSANATGSGAPSTTTDPALAGAATTAGTGANLLAYVPPGYVVAALIRFDRLRGSEWAAQTERLMQPMPDYQLLFGGGNAKLADNFESLVIATPRPRDAAATTLVARTRLSRGGLRDYLSKTNKVAWSAAKGGLLGRRSGQLMQGDQRVFLSPFRGWFLLAQPRELGGALVATNGNLDTIEASGGLPPWVASMRTIEAESGADRGPALVVTLALGGGRVDLSAMPINFGLSSVPLPERVTLAAEVVAQGWLVRGNARFDSAAAANEFVAAIHQLQQGIKDNTYVRVMLGQAPIRVVTNLGVAASGQRVSYSTSISIADMRALMAAGAQNLDVYFSSQRQP